MNLFVRNLLLGVLYAGFIGSFTAKDVLFGFVLGYAVLWLIRPALGETDYHDRVGKLLRFAGWYLVELFRANLRVARLALAPQVKLSPGVIALPLRCQTDVEIATYACLLTLTPGSVSVSLSSDRKTLYVHEMEIEPEGLEAFRHELSEGLERRVLELFRGPRAVALLYDAASGSGTKSAASSASTHVSDSVGDGVRGTES